MAYPELFILRHGETEWNAEGRMQGSLNSPLTPQGRAQAARQGEILKAQNLEAFKALTSPQGRAFETAAIAVAPLVPTVHTDVRLREIEVGEWSGKLRSELATPGLFNETPDGALELYEMAPGGEGFDRLEQRCRAFLEAEKNPMILVTHGITSRMLRSIILGFGKEGLSDMPGGQGVVYHLKDGMQKRLS